MSFSGFSFPNKAQNPQQNTGTQGTSGSTFGSFAAGLGGGGGGNTTSTGGGLFGGGTGTTTGTSNPPPSLFGGGNMTGTTSGNPPGGSLFGTKPAFGGGAFSNLGATGGTLGGTTANASTPTTAAPTTTTSGFFGTNPNPATTYGFNKPPEGAAAPATSNALGLNNTTTGTSNAAASSGNLFGNKTGATGGGWFGNLPGSTNPAATTTTGTTGGGLFGSSLASGINTNTSSGGLGLFGGMKPGVTTATTTTTPSGGLFDAKPTTVAPNTGTTSGSNIFGSLKPPGANATDTGTTAAPSMGTGSTATSTTAPATTGLNFFAPKTDTTTATSSAAPASTSATAAPALGGLFGGAKPTSAPGTGFGLGTANTAPAAGTTGTSTTAPGAITTTTTTTDTAKDAAKPQLGLGLGGGTLFSGLGAKPAVATTAAATTPTAAHAAATPTTAKTPTAAPVPAPSVLRGKTIEEVTKKWATELDDQAKEFAAVASEVAQWDRALVENGQYISTLYNKILEAEATQNAIDQNLDHVEQQQKELIAQLDKYEKETKEIFDGPTGGLRVIDMGPADAERDRNYTLAANLNLQLDELSKSLSQMIESVNALTLPHSPHATSSDPSTGGKKADDDPLQQIGAVLNAHLKSLQWIDETIRDVEGKVKEAERRMDGSAMSASMLGRGGFLPGETMRAGTPGGELPVSFAGMALRQSEGPRARGFGLSTTMRR